MEKGINISKNLINHQIKRIKNSLTQISQIVTNYVVAKVELHELLSLSGRLLLLFVPMKNRDSGRGIKMLPIGVNSCNPCEKIMK